MSLSMLDVMKMSKDIDRIIIPVSDMPLCDIEYFISAYENYNSADSVRDVKRRIYEARLHNMSLSLMTGISEGSHFKDEDVYYSVLYKKVFNENFSKWILKEFPLVRDYWCDPDSSYLADIEAFSRALNSYIADNIEIDDNKETALDTVERIMGRYK